MEEDPNGDERPSRRRRLPALVMIAVLAGAAAAVWVDLLRDEATADDRVSCSPAPASSRLTPVPYPELRTAPPSPPGKVAVLVRNSTSTRGLASRVAARLELFGFAEAAPPDNDPVYPTGTLRCRAQIRFGPDGLSAARTLSLVAPCAQLVRDDRAEGTVDLVLGTTFTALSPSQRAGEALTALTERDRPTGGLQAMPAAPAPMPRLPDLDGSRPDRC